MIKSRPNSKLKFRLLISILIGLLCFRAHRLQHQHIAVTHTPQKGLYVARTLERTPLSSSNQNPVAIFVGTRPEAIKLAPVVKQLKRDNVPVIVVNSGQHDDLLKVAAKALDLHFDVEFLLERQSNHLGQLFQSVFSSVYEFLASIQPALVLVQGDTSTAAAAALAAVHLQIDVAHVEAGLRTYDVSNPFPEESNRRIIDQVSTLLFPPTHFAMAALLHEGICASRIFMTGNTVVDTLLEMKSQKKESTALQQFRQLYTQTLSRNVIRILVTCHRRESQGEQMAAIFRAIQRVAVRCDGTNSTTNKAIPQCAFLFPLHRNPIVVNSATEILGGLRNVLLVDPLAYDELLQVYDNIDVIITDSGGIQEEAVSLGIPTFVIRNTTERPEGILAGVLQLLPMNEQSIYEAVVAWLQSRGITTTQGQHTNVHGNTATKTASVYGDGTASKRISAAIQDFLSSAIDTQSDCAGRVLQEKNAHASLHLATTTAANKPRPLPPRFNTSAFVTAMNTVGKSIHNKVEDTASTCSILVLAKDTRAVSILGHYIEGLTVLPGCRHIEKYYTALHRRKQDESSSIDDVAILDAIEERNSNSQAATLMNAVTAALDTAQPAVTVLDLRLKSEAAVVGVLTAASLSPTCTICAVWRDTPYKAARLCDSLVYVDSLLRHSENVAMIGTRFQHAVTTCYA